MRPLDETEYRKDIDEANRLLKPHSKLKILIIGMGIGFLISVITIVVTSWIRLYVGGIT